MKLRQFVIVATTLAIVASLTASSADAQTKVYRVGVLSPLAPLDASNPVGKALIAGLAKHGFVPGKNLVIESLGAQLHLDQLPALVAQMVAHKDDAILAFSYPAAHAAAQGTKTVPIVVLQAGDPVETHMVASFAHPGGNITGLSEIAADLSAKRLEVLKEAVPSIKRVAMLWNADDLGMSLRYQAAAAAATKLGITVQSLGVRAPDDFDEAFAAMTKEPPDGILMVSDALTTLNHKRIFEFAAEHRIPAIYEYDPLVYDGGLMSYGPDQGEMAARATDLLAQILQGAKPADLPLEQPTLFRLVINLKTAKAMGLTIPTTLIARADDVVE
jgi:putative ABC transport system substrate-binding protein